MVMCVWVDNGRPWITRDVFGLVNERRQIYEVELLDTRTENVEGVAHFCCAPVASTKQSDYVASV